MAGLFWDVDHNWCNIIVSSLIAAIVGYLFLPNSVQDISDWLSTRISITQKHAR